MMPVHDGCRRRVTRLPGGLGESCRSGALKSAYLGGMIYRPREFRLETEKHIGGFEVSASATVGAPSVIQARK